MHKPETSMFRTPDRQGSSSRWARPRFQTLPTQHDREIGGEFIILSELGKDMKISSSRPAQILNTVWEPLVSKPYRIVPFIRPKDAPPQALDDFWNPNPPEPNSVLLSEYLDLPPSDARLVYRPTNPDIEKSCLPAKTSLPSQALRWQNQRKVYPRFSEPSNDVNKRQWIWNKSERKDQRFRGNQAPQPWRKYNQYNGNNPPHGPSGESNDMTERINRLWQSRAPYFEAVKKVNLDPLFLEMFNALKVAKPRPKNPIAYALEHCGEFVPKESENDTIRQELERLNIELRAKRTLIKKKQTILRNSWLFTDLPDSKINKEAKQVQVESESDAPATTESEMNDIDTKTEVKNYKPEPKIKKDSKKKFKKNRKMLRELPRVYKISRGTQVNLLSPEALAENAPQI